MACFEDVCFEGELAIVEAFGEVFEFCRESPHFAVQAGDEKMGSPAVADDPVVESAEFARVIWAAIEDGFGFCP